MDTILFKILVVIAILVIITIVLKRTQIFNKKKESFMSIDILDIYTKDKYQIVLKTMLNEISTLFDKFNISFWIDDATLLDVIQNQNITFVNKGSFIIYDFDEGKLKSLKNIINNMGYELMEFWGGYKIYPLNGIDYKYFNREFESKPYSNETIKGIEDKEFYNNKFPYIDIYVMGAINNNNKFIYTNKYIRRTYPNDYYTITDVFPLKKYKIDNFYINGPKNPIPYLIRKFGPNWNLSKGKEFYDYSEPIYPRTSFKITKPINK